MQNLFTHSHKEGLGFLKSLMVGFSKRFHLSSVKFEKQMQGGWRLVVFLEEK